MLRHEFRPAKLVAGLFLTAAGVVYLGDAGDAWEAPWFVAIPLVVGGLCIAGAVATLDHAIRGRRGVGRTGPTGVTGTRGPAGPTGAKRATGAGGSPWRDGHG
ncbi:hypothetical protein [Streptomyces sp. SP17KL33]|uniref:hypothetical protein n=1 Tax=Streptomyces sp. SP17KL33 TaxID=3002534 RepID=UPI002E781DE9|nr:hypothetical protein [Streptomyces sp. SP17KL33]MEE1833840.1 hypothetical protein [Streptomyces sp. SP17KL33]